MSVNVIECQGGNLIYCKMKLRVKKGKWIFITAVAAANSCHFPFFFCVFRNNYKIEGGGLD